MVLGRVFDVRSSVKRRVLYACAGAVKVLGVCICFIALPSAVVSFMVDLSRLPDGGVTEDGLPLTFLDAFSEDSAAGEEHVDVAPPRRIFLAGLARPTALRDEDSETVEGAGVAEFARRSRPKTREA